MANGIGQGCIGGRPATAADRGADEQAESDTRFESHRQITIIPRTHAPKNNVARRGRNGLILKG
jgi:hypothetical protein